MTTARLYWALSLKEANLMQQTLIKKGIPLNSYCWKRNIVSKISPCFVEFKYPQWINQVVSWWFCPWDEIGIVDHKELHKHYISRWTKALLTETCEEKCSDFREPYTCTCSKYYKEKRCEQFYPEVKSCLGVKIIRPGSHSGPSCSKLG